MELKPCPFCGGKVNLTYNSGTNTFNFWHSGYHDVQCAAEQPIEFNGEIVRSLKEAADAWNRRATWNDNVNHPEHYTTGGIECIDAIRASLGDTDFASYCKGNVIKYIWRYRHKGGVEDLEKARVYFNWMIEAEGGEDNV